MQARNRIRITAAALFTSLVAGVLIATASLPPADVTSAPSKLSKAAVQASMVGVPTGEFENGIPVYRLPSVAVTVSRSEELAKMAREEQIASK